MVRPSRRPVPGAAVRGATSFSAAPVCYQLSPRASPVSSLAPPLWAAGRGEDTLLKPNDPWIGAGATEIDSKSSGETATVPADMAERQVTHAEMKDLLEAALAADQLDALHDAVNQAT